MLQIEYYDEQGELQTVKGEELIFSNTFPVYAYLDGKSLCGAEFLNNIKSI